MGYEISYYFIPPKTSKCGRARREPRVLMNAIVWVLRTGAPWCVLPEKYGPWHMAYNNFRKWTNQGVIEKIFETFATKPEKCSKIQINLTYVKAHQQSAGVKKESSNECIGKSRVCNIP